MDSEKYKTMLHNESDRIGKGGQGNIQSNSAREKRGDLEQFISPGPDHRA